MSAEIGTGASKATGEGNDEQMEVEPDAESGGVGMFTEWEDVSAFEEIRYKQSTHLKISRLIQTVDYRLLNLVQCLMYPASI